MNIKAVLVIVAVIVIVALLITTTGSNLSVMDSVEINRIQKRGTLLVGVRSDVPGFCADGEGLEIDIANKVGDRIFPDKVGNSVTFCNIASSQLDAHLSDDTIDIAFMLVPCDPSYRATKYAYSAVYYEDSCIFVVSKSNPGVTIEGMAIGVIKDSIFEVRAKNYISTKNKNATIVQYASYDMLLSAVAKGTLTCACISNVYYNTYKDDYAIIPLDIALPTISYAAVCSTSAPAVATVATLVIRELIESGELDSLITKHIGG